MENWLDQLVLYNETRIFHRFSWQRMQKNSEKGVSVQKQFRFVRGTIWAAKTSGIRVRKHHVNNILSLSLYLLTGYKLKKRSFLLFFPVFQDFL